MAAHSQFSPSGASRWLKCPASIRLSEAFPDTTNPASERGTDIHAQAEHVLLAMPGDGPHPEHQEYAIEYVEYVRGLVGEHDDLLVEHRLHFERYAPGGFGTADVVVLPKVKGVAKLCDLKTGRVPVPATTKQLEVYAVALLETFPDREIESVECHIWQSGRTDSVTYTRAELIEFAHNELAPAARAALDPSTRPVASAAACEWCKARHTCVARAVDVLSRAGELYGGSDLAVVLPAARQFEKWAQDVEALALERLKSGMGIAGFKLVAGTSRRQWREDAIDLVEAAGMSDLLTKRVLLGFGEIEKKLGKADAKSILDIATEKPAGKPTVVPADDPRADLNDF